MTFDDVTLKRELLDKWRLLNTDPRYTGKLAGPFFGHAPDTFAAAKTKTLYIGKATKGPFAEPDASQTAFGCNSGMFWSFASRLGAETGDRTDPLGNVAWSNLCRVGTIEGNPSPALAESQRELSVRIIKAEIAFLNPSLIVCVASDSPYDEFLYQVLNRQRGDDQFTTKQIGNMALYLRPSLDGFPPVLWMKHPERKSNEYLNFATAEALRLLAN